MRKLLLFIMICLVSEVSFAVRPVTELVLVEIRMRNGSHALYATDAKFTGGKTGAIAGQVVDTSGQPIANNPLVSWGQRQEGGHIEPIQLNLQEPTQIVSMVSAKTQVYDGTGVLQNYVKVMKPFGKKCSDTHAWSLIPISKIDSMLFYFQLTDTVKKQSKQFSFSEHFNQCTGSKLSMGTNPYFTECGHASAVEWVYNLPKTIGNLPSSWNYLDETHVGCNYVHVIADAKNSKSLRNAAVLMCAPNSMSSINYSEFKDIPANLLEKNKDEQLIHPSELLKKLTEGAPPQFRKNPNLFAKRAPIRCDFKAHMPEGP